MGEGVVMSWELKDIKVPNSVTNTYLEDLSFQVGHSIFAIYKVVVHDKVYSIEELQMECNMPSYIDNNGQVIYSKDMIELDIEEFCRLYSCINKIESIKDKDKVLYYIFRTKLFKSSRKLIRRLESSGFDVQSWFLNTYNIVHPISNKIDSVRFIQSLLGISDDSVITVGDAKDDLQMIKHYHSYGIVSYLPNFEVLRNCDVKVKSLNDAFKYINKNI